MIAESWTRRTRYSPPQNPCLGLRLDGWENREGIKLPARELRTTKRLSVKKGICLSSVSSAVIRSGLHDLSRVFAPANLVIGGATVNPPIWVGPPGAGYPVTNSVIPNLVAGSESRRCRQGNQSGTHQSS